MQVFSANYSLFKSGQIITENQVQKNWDLWFGYPETIITDFLTSTTVEQANEYLKNIQVPWRVSAVNIVEGVTQWTIA